MSNPVFRRCLRIRNLRSGIAEKFRKDLHPLCPVEKITCQDNTACIYLSREIKDFAITKCIELLNRYERNAPKYTITDIEEHTTIVVITNIPGHCKELDMNRLLSGFGKMVAKFQYARWKDDQTSTLKFGWVAYEDLRSAEVCVENIANMKIKNHFLRAGLLPSDISSPSWQQEIKTLEIEGFPRHWNEDKVRELLRAVCHAQYDIRYIKTMNLEVEGCVRCVALIDLDTPESAFQSFQRIDGFQADSKNGQTLCDIIASYALPGCSAFGNILKSLGMQVDTIQQEQPPMAVVREEIPGPAAGNTRPLSPPPPYEPDSPIRIVAQARPPHMQNRSLPPPYTPPNIPCSPPQVLQLPPSPQGVCDKPVLQQPAYCSQVNHAQHPLLLSQVVNKPQVTHLSNQELYDLLLSQGYQISVQQFNQIGVAAARHLAATAAAALSSQQTVNIQLIRPPPIVTPTQTQVIQNGRPSMVPFSNHFPPLPTITTRMQQNFPRPPQVRTRNVAPPFQRLANPMQSPTPQFEVARKQEKASKKVSPNQNQGRKNTLSPLQCANVNQIPQTSRALIPVCSGVTSTTVPTRHQPVTQYANPTVQSTTPMAQRNAKGSPAVATPWSLKKATPKRWSAAKRCKESPLQHEVILSVTEELKSINSSLNPSNNHQPVADINIDKVNTLSKRNILAEERCSEERDNLKEIEEAPIKLPNTVNHSSVLHALTQLAVVDAMNMKHIPKSTATTSNLPPEEDKSRLLSFTGCQSVPDGIWKPLPRQMFKNLF